LQLTTGALARSTCGALQRRDLPVDVAELGGLDLVPHEQRRADPADGGVENVEAVGDGDQREEAIGRDVVVFARFRRVGVEHEFARLPRRAARTSPRRSQPRARVLLERAADAGGDEPVEPGEVGRAGRRLPAART
jgi:hypothetical protein